MIPQRESLRFLFALTSSVYLFLSWGITPAYAIKPEDGCSAVDTRTETNEALSLGRLLALSLEDKKFDEAAPLFHEKLKVTKSTLLRTVGTIENAVGQLGKYSTTQFFRIKSSEGRAQWLECESADFRFSLLTHYGYTEYFVALSSVQTPKPADLKVVFSIVPRSPGLGEMRKRGKDAEWTVGFFEMFQTRTEEGDLDYWLSRVRNASSVSPGTSEARSDQLWYAYRVAIKLAKFGLYLRSPSYKAVEEMKKHEAAYFKDLIEAIQKKTKVSDLVYFDAAFSEGRTFAVLRVLTDPKNSLNQMKEQCQKAVDAFLAEKDYSSYGPRMWCSNMISGEDVSVNGRLGARLLSGVRVVNH